MAGTWPFYNNIRWGGPRGLRVPDEQFPGTITAFNTQIASGTADAVTFSRQLNLCIFTSTTDTGATLATPGANDVGKILILVNTNTTQNVVTTASGKILNGATTGLHLTAPATAGSVTVLIASNGFWNLLMSTTGTWVLS